MALFLQKALFGREIKRYGGGDCLKLFIQEPWWTEIKEGRKTVEGRAAHKGRYNHMIGHNVCIISPKTGQGVDAKVTKVRHYDTLDEYFEGEGWETTAPHTGSLEMAKKAYAEIRMKGDVQVFSEQRVRERGGIEAIVMKLV